MDRDRNFLFDDAGGSFLLGTTDHATFTGSITAPPGNAPGPVRMRVRLNYFNEAANRYFGRQQIPRRSSTILLLWEGRGLGVLCIQAHWNDLFAPYPTTCWQCRPGEVACTIIPRKTISAMMRIRKILITLLLGSSSTAALAQNPQWIASFQESTGPARPCTS